MSAFLAIVRKQFIESRWLLGLSAAALFGLSWLSVYNAARIQADLARGERLPGYLRRQFGSMIAPPSAVEVEMALWGMPGILLPVIIWAIARGSGAIAGEIERGTMDLVLSRPVSRASFLGAQVSAAALGFLVLLAALVVGNLAATRYHPVDGPPGMAALLKPALNLGALGVAIFGYTLAASACDLVRWRPNLIASTATLAGVILRDIARLPSLEPYKDWLERLSIFKAYNPMEVATAGQTLAFNAGVLGGIAALGIALAAAAFLWRDLPSSG